MKQVAAAVVLVVSAGSERQWMNVVTETFLERRLPSSDEPERVVATTYDGMGILLPYFEDAGLEASLGAFLVSLGLASTPELRREWRSTYEWLASSEAAEELGRTETRAHRHRAMVPVIAYGVPEMAAWPENATTAESAAAAFVERTVPSSTDGAALRRIVDLVAAQLRIRDAARQAQERAFGPERPEMHALFFQSNGSGFVASSPSRDDDDELAAESRPRRKSSSEGDACVEKGVPSAATLVARGVIADGPIPVAVINLWWAGARRRFMRRQLDAQPPGSLRVGWVSGVDGVYLPKRVLFQVAAEDVALSQGEIGIYLSHMTAWRDVLDAGLPFAVILEDDAHLRPDFSLVLRRALDFLVARLGTEWDLLALDFGLAHHDLVGAPSTRRSGVQAACVAAAAAVDAPVLRLDDGCAHVSIGGYVVSHRGARRLLESALPMRHPVDVYALRQVREDRLEAFAALPPTAHVEAFGTSDSVRRYIRVQDGEVLVTFDPIRGSDHLTCHRLPCQITILH